MHIERRFDASELAIRNNLRIAKSTDPRVVCPRRGRGTGVVVPPHGMPAMAGISLTAPVRSAVRAQTSTAPRTSLAAANRESHAQQKRLNPRLDPESAEATSCSRVGVPDGRLHRRCPAGANGDRLLERRRPPAAPPSRVVEPSTADAFRRPIPARLTGESHPHRLHGRAAEALGAAVRLMPRRRYRSRAADPVNSRRRALSQRSSAGTRPDLQQRVPRADALGGRLTAGRRPRHP